MALYSFTLERLHIDTTRSRGDDTDTVSFAVGIGRSSATATSAATGDVDGGDVGLNLAFAPQFVATGEKAVMSYFVFNGDASKLHIGLDDLSRKVIDQYIQQGLEGGPSNDPGANIPDDPGLPDNATFGDPSWGSVLQFAAIGDFLFPDCDGMVAADLIARSKTELDTAIDSGDGTTFRQSRRYPGSDSPAGCGANSDYTVTWSIARVRDAGPGLHGLRNFLAANNMHLLPGLRSLRPGGSQIGIKDLLM
jgi:hypothetical protein